MTRPRMRVIAAVGAIAVASSFASAFPAGAASKPNKAKAACTEALLQGNQIVARLGDMGGILADAQTALGGYASSTRDAAAGQKLYTDLQAAFAKAFALAPQIQAAEAAYSDGRTACQKALGIKEADVTPTTAPTTTPAK